MTVLAPRVWWRDPRRARVGDLEIRRFDYGARGRRLKQFGARPSIGVLLRYAASALRALRLTLDEQRFDAVYAHWLLPAGFLAAVGLAASRKAALAVHIHGSDVNAYAAKKSVWRLLARLALLRADKALAVSRPLRDWAERNGAPDCEFLPMGVDRERFVPATEFERTRARAAWKIEPNRVALLFPGGTSSSKGYDLVLAALMRLKKPLDLIIAGSCAPRVHRAVLGCDRLPGPRVRFVGSIPHERMPQLYAAVDALVLPSRAEGSPLAVAEACACGLPVIATALGDIPRLVAGAPEARLVPPLSGVEALTQAIEAWLAKASQGRPRRSYGQVADIDGVTERVLELLVSSVRARNSTHVG